MIESITFLELVKLLPRGDEFQSPELPSGLRYTEPNPQFVEPRFSAERPVEVGRTAAIIVAAPGAVGKSTLAAELASRTGAVVWDLSKMNVGSKTLAGTVLEGWNAEAHGVLKRVADGRWLFVFDALDEAEVRAGSQNFETFLRDLVRIWPEAPVRPTLVLLARTDTADLVQLHFEEGGVALARYQVEYFNKQQAVEFIEKRLDAERIRDGLQAIHRQQPVPFAAARDALFGLVYGLFEVGPLKAWDDPRVRDFLGYAPVLEAFAEYLDVRNYGRLIEELQDEKGAAHDPWQLLTSIIRRLQEREQRKIQDDFVAPVLASMPAARERLNPATLFNADEQCSRVLRHSLRLPATPPAGLDLPIALSDRYEEALATFLPQHPFLSSFNFANVVFKEFAYAWGIARAETSTQNTLRNVMRKREAPFMPSPIFSRFVAHFDSLIDGQDFGIVYESLLARSGSVELSLVESGDEIEARVHVGNEPEALAFTVMDTGPGVHFWWRLKEADVDVARAVRLGLLEQRFTLGPSVNISCGDFAVQCEHLDVDAAGDVWIRAESNVTTGNLRLRVRDPSAGRLSVAWPEVVYPWASYRAKDDLTLVKLAATPRGDALRKLVLMFRRQRTRKVDTVRKARWSPEQLRHRDELLSLARVHGVLVEEQHVLRFNSDFDSLKTLLDERPSLSAAARGFVVAYLGEDLTRRL